MSKEVTKKPGRTIADFRAAHDKDFIVPQKIRECIAKLGPEGWDYEAQFMKISTPPISTTDLAKYREGFTDFWLEVGGHSKRRVWCGSKGLADKLRAMI